MFDTPRQNARVIMRGIRFSDREIKKLRILQGKRTFSAYVRELIYKDYAKRPRKKERIS